MTDLLIELFSEEIPARMQKKASDDLKKMITDALITAGLTFKTASAYATPRRLALCVTDVPTATPDISEERRGPRADAPDKALEGFMRGAGVTKEHLEQRTEKKGTFYYAKIEKPGREARDVIAEAIEATVRDFSWPKSQRWGSGTLKWVRPLHSIIALFGTDVVDINIDGIKAGNMTQGHKFMAPKHFSVTDFSDYQTKLLNHKVILDAEDRASHIYDNAVKLAASEGMELVEDKSLLHEVVGLVEWPVPMIGTFDASFLDVPEDVLVLTMRKDQKYFVTRDPSTSKLANKFIFTANLTPSDDGSVVTGGNERVLSARLSDAKFFWDQDLKGALDGLLPALKNIVFHVDLGTVADRVARIKSLAGEISQYIDGCDKADAERAAELAKADLTSNMVYEFPELQGVMGRYYALKQGESAAVADAIRDHYAPAGPSDMCPSAPVSIAVALAEKLDTLVGFFCINQKPTGSKDPYALRRAALGVIRLILENDVRLKLSDMIASAVRNYHGEFSDVSADLIAFFNDRLKVQQRDKGVRHDLIDAVAASGDDDLVRVLTRVDALGQFIDSDDGANLLAGYKRAANILKIEEKKDAKAYDGLVNADLFIDENESVLFKALNVASNTASEAVAAEDFTAAMAALSSLRAPVDTFFDAVMVNADDAQVRMNRLNLLASIRLAVDTVADFSCIEG